LNKAFDYTYLSLGAGVQSSAMLVCSCKGLYNVPRADVAIFADTGDEPQWVYDYLAILTEWSDIPVVIAKKGHLSVDLIQRNKDGKRAASIPVFMDTGDRTGLLMRQCTREYKVEPIEKKVRELLGYKPRQRIKERVQALLGISIDEVIRMRPSRTRWITNAHPLIDAGLNRFSCLRICKEAGLPEPKRSACVFCPYHSNKYWMELKDNHPKEFKRAVDFDVQIRDMSMGGLDHPAFLHRSLMPLSEVNFDDSKGQMEMFGEECEGVCGV